MELKSSSDDQSTSQELIRMATDLDYDGMCAMIASDGLEKCSQTALKYALNVAIWHQHSELFELIVSQQTIPLSESTIGHNLSQAIQFRRTNFANTLIKIITTEPYALKSFDLCDTKFSAKTSAETMTLFFMELEIPNNFMFIFNGSDPVQIEIQSCLAKECFNVVFKQNQTNSSLAHRFFGVEENGALANQLGEAEVLNSIVYGFL